MPLRAVFRPVAGDILLLAAWPILLLAIDAEWAFTEIGTIDPWVYFGTFINLSYNVTSFAQTYYVGRLSWILPGYAMHAVLPPVAANLCLHLAVFYGGTFGCYSCLRMTAGRRPALVAAMLLGAYQPFINAAGWDYVDGAGIAYFLLTLACATAAGRSRRPWVWNAASGMFAAACVITNLAWLLVMPGCVIYLIVLSPRLPFSEHARRGLAMGAGALVVILACAFVYARFTGNYWFFLGNIEGVRLATSQPGSGQAYDWVWVVPSLGTASALFLISLIRVIQLLARGGSTSSIALHAVWIWSATALLAAQIAGIPVLQLSYYASYLLPGMALATGELVARPVQQISSRVAGLILAFGAAAWLWVFAGPGAVHLFPGIRPFVVTAALVMLAAIVLWHFATRPFAVAAGLAVLVLLTVVQQNKNVVEPGERQRNYQITVDALDQLKPIQAEKPFFFWYPDETPRALLSAYTAISSCYLWGFRLFSAKFPARTRPEGYENQPRPGLRIVLMTGDRREPEEIEQALGASIRVVHEARLARGGMAFNMVVFDVR